MAAFLASFSPLLSALAAGDPELPDRWQSLDQLAGQHVRVRQSDRIITGTGRGFDTEGALLLETDHGLETIVGGQVLRP
jgi:BirA family biotin operon repressor/biotin-[acetyl-CoA-carboxylase] ligase